MKKTVCVAFLSLFAAMPAWAAVDLNSATQSELEAVKGIGPSKAKAIVSHREKYGAFKSVDDLAQIKGFGPASVTKLKAELSVGEAKAAKAK